MLLYTRIRSFPPSAINKCRPSEKANLGKFIVEPQRFGYVGLLAGSVPVETVHITGLCLFVVSVDDVAAVPVNALLGTEEVMSGCQSSRSAGCWFWVGMEFHISTRLWPRSVTNSRCPSEVTDTGENRLLACAGVSLTVEAGAVLKFGSPKTTSAGWLFELGRLVQIITR